MIATDQIVKELARPFPPRYVQQNPSGGGRYVTHSVVTQRLIEVLGVPPVFELGEVIRGDVAAIEPNPNGNSQRAKKGAPPLTNAVVGAVCRMTVVLGPKDEWQSTTVVEEAGDCEDPHNWPHDGARLKDAMSDAYKRCAMRLGCGLHLWSKDQNDYFLFDHLNVEASGVPITSEERGGVGGHGEGTPDPVTHDKPAGMAVGKEAVSGDAASGTPLLETPSSDGDPEQPPASLIDPKSCPHGAWTPAALRGWHVCQACGHAEKVA